MKFETVWILSLKAHWAVLFRAQTCPDNFGNRGSPESKLGVGNLSIAGTLQSHSNVKVNVNNDRCIAYPVNSLTSKILRSLANGVTPDMITLGIISLDFCKL